MSNIKDTQTVPVAEIRRQFEELKSAGVLAEPVVDYYVPPITQGGTGFATLDSAISQGGHKPGEVITWMGQTPPSRDQSELEAKTRQSKYDILADEPHDSFFPKKMLDHAIKISHALELLTDVGFTLEQAEHVRKAIAKQRTSQVSQYRWQFDAFCMMKAQEGNSNLGFPIRRDELWKTIVDAFLSSNPIKPYTDIVYCEHAEVIEMNKAMADQFGLHKPVRVRTVKPNQPTMKKMFGVSEGIEPHYKQYYHRSAYLSSLIFKGPIVEVGDYVKIIDGPHRGSPAVIIQIADHRVDSKVLCRLLEAEGDVTLPYCRLSFFRMKNHKDYIKDEKVRINYGPWKGHVATVFGCVEIHGNPGLLLNIADSTNSTRVSGWEIESISDEDYASQVQAAGRAGREFHEPRAWDMLMEHHAQARLHAYAAMSGGPIAEPIKDYDLHYDAKNEPQRLMVMRDEVKQEPMNVCTCDIGVLMVSGCKCGHMKK